MSRTSFNTEVVLGDDVVTKTTLRAFPIERGRQLVDDIYRYCEAFDQEPLDVPELQRVEMVPVDEDSARVRIVASRNYDPNLQAVPRDDAVKPLAVTVERIALMNTLGSSAKLVTPIDAAGPNFHVSYDGNATLVDVFPPLIRRSDGEIPLENIQFSGLPLRRRHIEYYRGTRIGAILRTMTTVSLGYSPVEQMYRASRRLEWCHDAVPACLPALERDTLHHAIRTRFARDVIVGGISDAICLAALKIGVQP